MSAWTCRHTDGKVVQKIVPPRPRIPYWKGPGADSEEKHEPASDIDTVVVDSLKVLDPKWPIREADSSRTSGHVRFVPILLQKSKIERPRKSRESRFLDAATTAKPFTADTKTGGRFCMK